MRGSMYHHQIQCLIEYHHQVQCKEYWIILNNVEYYMQHPDVSNEDKFAVCRYLINCLWPREQWARAVMVQLEEGDFKPEQLGPPHFHKNNKGRALAVRVFASR